MKSQAETTMAASEPELWGPDSGETPEDVARSEAQGRLLAAYLEALKQGGPRAAEKVLAGLSQSQRQEIQPDIELTLLLHQASRD